MVLENLIGMSHIEAARGEYSAYRLVVYIIIIVVYLSCARINVLWIHFHSFVERVLLRVQSFLRNRKFFFAGNSSFFFFNFFSIGGYE